MIVIYILVVDAKRKSFGHGNMFHQWPLNKLSLIANNHIFHLSHKLQVIKFWVLETLTMCLGVVYTETNKWLDIFSCIIQAIRLVIVLHKLEYVDKSVETFFIMSCEMKAHCGIHISV